ncbi:MAG: Cas10/Cmr2 second palm domain-containing protein, partial [Pseudanabaena sp.]
MYLVLIETSGNQNYIFSTNKLKENIGASDLTYRSGTKWVLEAVAEVTKSNYLSLWTVDGKQLAKNLMNPDLNPPINSANSKGAEIVLAASGKAILIVKEEKKAKDIIKYVSTASLTKAPGLEIYGTFEKFDWDKDKLGEINQKVHDLSLCGKSQKPSSHLRFLRLPVIDECKTSGLPASESRKNPEGELDAISEVSKFKQDQQPKAFERIQTLIGSHYGAFTTESDYTDNIEKGSDWLAVIHADGNGLGEIFLRFHDHIKATDAQKNRDYIDKLRRFSLALDDCTLGAFRTALEKVPQLSQRPDYKPQCKEGVLRLVPLVLGGDDLTVVCDGRYALNFTYEFLKAFEEETAKTEYYGGIIGDVAKEALNVGRLSACAGVAIVKLHFPFSVAYELAESLMKSAKTVKKNVTDPNDDKKPYPCSALDFHVLYDSSNVDLGKIRDKLVVKDGDNPASRLYQRPYVVTELANIQEAS